MAKTLTFYYSLDCPGCHQLEPEIKKAAQRHGYKFKKVNVESCDSEICNSMEFVPSIYVGKRELSVEDIERLIGEGL